MRTKTFLRIVLRGEEGSQGPCAKNCVRSEWAFGNPFPAAETCRRLTVRILAAVEDLSIVSGEGISAKESLMSTRM